jgi:hypothetical protein
MRRHGVAFDGVRSSVLLLSSYWGERATKDQSGWTAFQRYSVRINKMPSIPGSFASRREFSLFLVPEWILLNQITCLNDSAVWDCRLWWKEGANKKSWDTFNAWALTPRHECVSNKSRRDAQQLPIMLTWAGAVEQSWIRDMFRKNILIGNLVTKRMFCTDVFADQKWWIIERFLSDNRTYSFAER